MIILTGSETRHEFFRKYISNDSRIKVLSTYCEGDESSLENRVKGNENSTLLEHHHVQARSQAEIDFFGSSISHIDDKSNPIFIKKGEINDEKIVSEIINQNPDLLVCYGASLIKSNLLNVFQGRFLNVHLGLSPYYRGSGTNVWPLINDEPEMVGATFMYIDAGIDTGQIIHQIRADIFLGDSPHSIGNRLIRKMTETYAEIIANFENLKEVKQPNDEGKLYMIKDFDGVACRKLYQNFNDGMIENFFSTEKDYKYIVENPGISS